MLSVWVLVGRVPRILRFVAVGSFCTLLQLAILALLAEGGVWTDPANVLGFLISTQVNAVLSYTITWAERRDRSAGVPWRTLFAFNATALVALCVNEAVFALAQQSLHYLPAAILGTLASSTLNYALSNRVVFRLRCMGVEPRRREGAKNTKEELSAFLVFLSSSRLRASAVQVSSGVVRARTVARVSISLAGLSSRRRTMRGKRRA